ncbi:MAG: sodium:calcium antiporter [Candidatus Riflebacteria bacterium HGW-Riflebacteria-2]|jgi:cation:H+ antiporter|nr:MAG: sodium:calcium antiporter [Candidatus Riflebacteria bacterium HGW-Riflebacteria-2]
MFLSITLCIIGFIILSYAADKLVEGASNLAMNFGVSKTVIGLTIVAAGTSLPEMVVSVNASLKGNPAISLGNVVGSNIMNVALILGIASLIKPIQCSREMVRRETPIMIFTALLMWYVAHTDGVITPAEGIIMFVMLFAYTGLSYYWSRKESAIAAEIAEKCDEFATTGSEETPTTTSNVVYVIIGMIGLVIGSEVLVRGAVDIARTFGLSDEVIGLTLIAIGTSLPELATSIVAARKGQSEISLGNVVGSNIFNVLGIVGCASTIAWFNTNPEAQVLVVSPNMLGIHIPLMVVVSLGVLPIMSTGMRIIRAEGALLVAVYLAYNVILFQTTAPAVPPRAPRLHDMPVDSDTTGSGNNASAAHSLPTLLQENPTVQSVASLSEPVINNASDGKTETIIPSTASGSTGAP